MSPTSVAPTKHPYIYTVNYTVTMKYHNTSNAENVTSVLSLILEYYDAVSLLSKETKNGYITLRLMVSSDTEIEGTVIQKSLQEKYGDVDVVVVVGDDPEKEEKSTNIGWKWWYDSIAYISNNMWLLYFVFINRNYFILCIFVIFLIASLTFIIFKAIKIQKENKAAAELEAAQKTIDAVMEMEQRHHATNHPDEQFHIAPNKDDEHIEENESSSGDSLFVGGDPQPQTTKGTIRDMVTPQNKCTDCHLEKAGIIYPADGMFYCFECYSLYDVPTTLQQNESAEGAQDNMNRTIEGGADV